MLRIDNSLLVEVGLGSLPDVEKNSLLKHILETLEMRVGVRLADQMTNTQLDEFEKYFEAKDDTGAFKWLETNFPNYKEIVQEEFDKLKEEIRQSAPGILHSSQNPQHPTVNSPTDIPVLQPQQGQTSESIIQPTDMLNETVNSNSTNPPILGQDTITNQDNRQVPISDQQPPPGPPQA